MTSKFRCDQECYITAMDEFKELNNKSDVPSTKVTYANSLIATWDPKALYLKLIDHLLTNLPISYRPHERVLTQAIIQITVGNERSVSEAIEALSLRWLQTAEFFCAAVITPKQVNIAGSWEEQTLALQSPQSEFVEKRISAEQNRDKLMKVLIHWFFEGKLEPPSVGYEAKKENVRLFGNIPPAGDGVVLDAINQAINANSTNSIAYVAKTFILAKLVRFFPNEILGNPNFFFAQRGVLQIPKLSLHFLQMLEDSLAYKRRSKAIKYQSTLLPLACFWTSPALPLWLMSNRSIAVVLSLFWKKEATEEAVKKIRNRYFKSSSLKAYPIQELTQNGDEISTG